MITKTTKTKKSTTKNGVANVSKSKSTITSRQKKETKRALICADGEQCFWTTDGKIIANLIELRDTLAHMSEAVFHYHVTKQRNDFADWIEAVLDDAEFAKIFKTAQKPHTARLLVVRKLREYGI